VALAQFHARVRQTETDPPVDVRVLAPKEITRLPREDAEAQLSALLQQVRVRPELMLYGFSTLASYVDPPDRTALFGHNTLVEISLPYTLHVPTGMVFEVKCPEIGAVTVVLRKVWTNLATGSNEAEVCADDQLLYYGPTRPLSPFVPQAPELGPWPHFTGTNIEIGKDTHGVFRYTQIRTLFDLEIEGEDSDGNVEAARSRALEKAKTTAMTIVNYVLDVYRYVTGAEHVERLSIVSVNRVYFADCNFVSEGVAVAGGVGSAVVNRSWREIRQIQSMLAAGQEPERHVLLIQSARSALDRGQLVLAIVVGFQALEILIETKLRAAYKSLGAPAEEINERLKTVYKTKERLTVLCREVTNGLSVADDTVFWDSWLKDCNRKRNGVVHRNEAVSHPEALKVVELCEQCVLKISALPFPS
jgi:hypothetical protein